MTDRQSILSLPSLLVLALVSWGILQTAPALVSLRPRAPIETLRLGVGHESIPSRLWQDPLAAAYRVHADSDAGYDAVCFVDMLQERSATKDGPASVLCLSVLLPGDQYPEDAAQCRRRRFATVSALGRVGFVPRRREAIGYMEYPNLLVPFEWFDQHDGDTSILLHWIDESQISDSPLGALSRIHKDFHDAGLETGAGICHAIVGPLSSTTLLRMWEEREKWKDMPETAIYSTQATATETRNQTASDWPDHLNVHHFIGTDAALARQIKGELSLRGVKFHKHPITLIGEWDTHYGRNMLATLSEVFADGNSDGNSETKIHQIRYLRGLDGLSPSETRPPLSSTDDGGPANLLVGRRRGEKLVYGRAQTDYVRRFVHRLKEIQPPIRAIGVAGSDVYDKLLMIRALRHEFPTTPIFTTDLDARLVDRSEYVSTHNLLIASHYDLSLAPALQETTPPFRDSYQSSLFLGTLTLLKNEGLIDDDRDKELLQAIDGAGKFDEPLVF